MLITVIARLVRPYGTDEVALPGSGRIEYSAASHGTHEGALRGRETVFAKIVDGDAEPVDLVPGPWHVRVVPADGEPWPSWLVELEDDMDGPVELVDLAPGGVVAGEKWAKGDPGDPGASITGAVDNGDQTVSFTLSDGTETEAVPIPPGPAGVGVASISDPDDESRVTSTYTDGSTSTVQAIVGKPGDDGHTPEISWDGTALVIDGEPGPDLKGKPGDPGKDSTVPGPANTLTIGTVKTGESGSPASASITGEAPEQTLDLVLPSGEQGLPGEAALQDTGWRKIDLPETHVANDSHGLYVRRIGKTVHMAISFQAEDAGGNPTVWEIASGFRPKARFPMLNAPAASAMLTDTNGGPQNPRTLVVSSAGRVNIFNADAGRDRIASLAYLTDDTWPTSNPGSAA
ncbi:MAG: hypothetical protein L0K01_07990 [Brachybacterium sp.]|nr:hypothetical protein [Brachybacterium sp.]